MSALPHDDIQLDGDPAAPLLLPTTPPGCNATAHPIIGTFADWDSWGCRPAGSRTPFCTCELTPSEPKLLQFSFTAEGALTRGSVSGGPGLKAYQTVEILLPDLASTLKLVSFVVFLVVLLHFDGAPRRLNIAGFSVCCEWRREIAMGRRQQRSTGALLDRSVSLSLRAQTVLFPCSHSNEQSRWHASRQRN